MGGFSACLLSNEYMPLPGRGIFAPRQLSAAACTRESLGLMGNPSLNLVQSKGIVVVTGWLFSHSLTANKPCRPKLFSLPVH